MTVTKVRRLVNPSPARRRMSPAQIAIFGTPAQKAALKKGKRSAGAASPRHRKASARSSRNPATMITLGLVNPQPVRKAAKTTMARTKKRTTAKHRTTKRRSNPHTKTHTKRRNGTTKIYVKRNSRRRSRNPEILSGMTAGQSGKAILAGLVGVYATKTLTPMITSMLPSMGGSPLVSAVISGIIAYGGGMVIGKQDSALGRGFTFGGLMQAGSTALNSMLPSNPITLSGLGDFHPASFSVPQNPIMAAAQQRIAAAQVMAPTGGVRKGAGVGAWA
jgi:hypothetical protein